MTASAGLARNSGPNAVLALALGWFALSEVRSSGTENARQGLIGRNLIASVGSTQRDAVRMKRHC